MKYYTNRDSDYGVMDIIRQRWSSRAFDQEREISDEDLGAMLEAAGMAPSCFNEQPWRFVVARKGTAVFDAICETMTPGNQDWAPKASVLLVMCNKTTFTFNGHTNRFAAFDQGTAWGYLTLEAQRRGILTHGMGGFNPQALREALGIEADYEIMALAAAGYYGDKSYLPEKVQGKEKPSPRKSVEEITLDVKI